MNKRFSTLLAAALVAGGLSANAQSVTVNGSVTEEIPATPVRNYVLATKTAFSGTGAVLNGTTKTSLKVVDAGNRGIFVQSNKNVATNINDELWTISFETVKGSNRFVLTNKATGLTLSFDPKNAIAADANGAIDVSGITQAQDYAGVISQGAEDTKWTWVSAPNAKDDLKKVLPLTCAFKSDSTMSLLVTTDAAGYGGVYAYKYANDKVPTTITGGEQLKIQAVQPGSLAMTAADLNVLDGGAAGKYFTLSTSKENLIGDAISGVKFQATDATTTGYVTLKELGTSKYLRVDTALHAATGAHTNMLYKLDRKELKAGQTATAIAANQFKIEKNLFTDSVFVSIPQAGSRFSYSETADGNGSHWYTAVSSGTVYSYCTLSSVLLTNDTEVMTFYNPATPTTATLVPENLLFAVSSPEADKTFTSLEDGVYFVKNKAGKYLAMPIYAAQKDNVADVKWVTVDEAEQNPAHMPAYQWVVLKEKTADKLKATSPLVFNNREFNGSYAVQLKKNEGAEYYYVASNGGLFVTADSLEFVKVPEASLGDQNLGYKFFEANDLKVNRYTFNYLHAYADDKFLAKSEKDSLATVLNGKQAFAIEADGAAANYGYIVSSAVAARIPGLKTLKRQAYKVYVPAVNEAYLGYNKEDKFAITSETTNMTAVSFWFKENNDLEGDDNCYYAMVVKPVSTEDYSKAGVTDDDLSATLKHQVYSETRTSAFLIAPYDAPLYRRFNSEKLEGNVGDAADTLRFKEKYRNEYLQVENNKNFMVDGIKFLGIYTPDFTKDGKSFIVDTAFVNRWNGNIKPQYLISINRQDQAFQAGEMCPVCQEIVANGGTRPANCPHDKAGKLPFHFGEYLVNFADSVQNAVDKEDYGWKGYTRAGFVKAAHQGDSLFILTGQFADVTVATFDSAKIKKAVADGDYAAKYIVNLQGDAHKLVTWSMRYLDPENAANEVEEDRAFLMESMAQNPADVIAPIEGSWLKMQNGCLVMSGSNGSTSTFDQFTDDDDALIFTVEQGNKKDLATDNEEIATSEVTVIAGEGQLTIANAAGKKVVVSNILGQVVANTVLSSDNATIAAPQGVVVVAVEGEEAVKAIVK